MMLLDTNVISELGKAPARRDPKVVAWMEAQDSALVWTSVVCLEEIERGVLSKERKDQEAGRALRAWFENQVLSVLGSRAIAVDANVASTAAAMGVPDPRPLADRLIAATAAVHGLSVATRNVADFEPLGVRVVDPWSVGMG